MTTCRYLFAHAIVCWLLLLVSIPGHGAPYIELNNEFQSNSLLEYADYLLDPSGDLDLAQVTSQPWSNQFSPAGTRQLSIGRIDGAIWLRFSVRNRLPRTTPLLIELLPPDISDIQVFEIERGSGTLVYSGGLKLPFEQRDIKLTPFIYELNSPADSHKTWFIKISSRNNLKLEANLTSYKQYLVNSAFREWYTGSLYGALFLLFVLNLIFSTMYSDRNYTWQCLVLATTIGYLSASWGYLYQMFDQGSDWVHTDFTAFVFAGQFFSLLIVRNLGNSWQSSGRIDGSLKLLMVLNFLAVLLAPMLQAAITASMTYFLTLATTSYIVGLGVYAFYHYQNVPLLFYALSKLWFFIAAFVAITSVRFDLIDSQATDLWVMGAVVVEGFMITLSLQYRTSTLYQRQLRRKQQEELDETSSTQLRGMLSRIGHDVRTPMNGILGMAELLRQTPLNDRQSDYVRGISSSGHALLNRINQVLDLVRMQSGEMQLKSAPFYPREMVEECVDAFRFEAADRGIEFVVDIDSETENFLKGDASRIKQVLMAMLGNSFQYTERGEIILKVRSTLKGGRAQLSFRVIDTGSGIPKPLENALSKPGASKQSASIDAGFETVNLLLARDIAQAMKGRFDIEEQKPHGCNTYFSVDLSNEAEGTVTPADSDELLNDRKILIVDDNASYRKVLEQITVSWGMRPTSARSGAEALAKIKSGSQLQQRFDIIVMDQNMPAMTGMQAAEKIKAILEVPVVLLTGLDVNLDSEDFARCGIVAALSKPVSGNNLKHAVSDGLGKRNLARGLTQQLNVLVAEDNVVSAQVLSGMLSRLDTSHKIVRNGHEALMAIKEESFDLILMDCEMPGMDGFEASEMIRLWQQEHQGLRTPIIALSALTADELDQRIHQHGMDTYLTKPIDIAHLRYAMQQWASPAKPDPGQNTPRQ